MSAAEPGSGRDPTSLPNQPAPFGSAYPASRRNAAAAPDPAAGDLDPNIRALPTEPPSTARHRRGGRMSRARPPSSPGSSSRRCAVQAIRSRYGYPKGSRSYKINMQQALLLALMNARFYQYQSGASLPGGATGDAPAIFVRAPVLRGHEPVDRRSPDMAAPAVAVFVASTLPGG